MADAAAFFANKKKGKKKAFKFNANNIDAATVSQTVHVDAPSVAASSQLEAAGGENDKDSAGEQWDDAALAATLTRKTATTAAGTTSELMDMKAFDPKRNEQDNIAEKLRVEENKAKLAAAREGMAREATRLKEDKEKKKEAASGTAPRFAAAAGGGGGKWVPSHMRGGGMAAVRMGGAMSSKVDTQDEQLFPDLAAADSIIKQQEKHQQPVYKVVKKTPVGGGATWASKSKIQAKAATAPKKAEPAPEAAPVEAPAAPSPENPKTTTTEPSVPKVATKTLGKKKKKKDLSTFKA